MPTRYVSGVWRRVCCSLPSAYGWVLVSLYQLIEDCVSQFLCFELLNAKCLDVIASVFDESNQLFDLLPSSSLPLQMPKMRLRRDQVG